MASTPCAWAAKEKCFLPYYGLDKHFKTVDARIESLDAVPDAMHSQMNAIASEGDRSRKLELKEQEFDAKFVEAKVFA